MGGRAVGAQVRKLESQNQARSLPRHLPVTWLTALLSREAVPPCGARVRVIYYLPVFPDQASDSAYAGPDYLRYD